MAGCSWRLSLVLGVSMLGLGGCQNKEQQAEMAALAQTNQDLQKDREAAMAAAAAADERAKEAEARANEAALAAANNKPQNPGGWTEPQGQPRPIPQPPQVLTMAGDVAFASGSADLTSAGKKELDGMIKTINGQYSNNTIKIEGYTDNTPLVKTKAKWGSNLGLSQARAESVMRYLSSKGIDSSRMEAVGMGEANPKSTKALSRRVEIHIMSH